MVDVNDKNDGTPKEDGTTNPPEGSNPPVDKNAHDHQLEPKMVPERDLMAVKSKLDNLEAEVIDWRGKAAKFQDDFALMKANKEGLDTQLKSFDTVNAELSRTKDMLAASNKSREELETGLLDSKRTLLQSKGIEDKFLEGKTLSELTLVEQALHGISGNGKSSTQGFDIGSLGNGGNRPLTEMESDLRIIERARQKSVK
jgi:hypothetical protein